MTSSESSVNFDGIWQLSDPHDLNSHSEDHCPDRSCIEPSKQFLRPATFGTLKNSIGPINTLRVHDQNNRSTSFFTLFNEQTKPETINKSKLLSKRLPRTLLSNDNDSNAIYAIPQKAAKSMLTLPTTQIVPVNSTSTLYSTPKNAESPSWNKYNSISPGKLFKRYEVGSILSSTSNEQSPTTDDNHVHNNNPTMEDDNVIYFLPASRRTALRQKMSKAKENVARKMETCVCTTKIKFLLVLAIFIMAAVIAVVAGVAVANTRKSSTSASSHITERLTTVSFASHAFQQDLTSVVMATSNTSITVTTESGAPGNAVAIDNTSVSMTETRSRADVIDLTIESTISSHNVTVVSSEMSHGSQVTSSSSSLSSIHPTTGKASVSAISTTGQAVSLDDHLR